MWCFLNWMKKGVASDKMKPKLPEYAPPITVQWNHPLSFDLSSGFFPLLDFIVRKWPKNRNEEARKISWRNAHSSLSIEKTLLRNSAGIEIFPKPRTKLPFGSSIKWKAMRWPMPVEKPQTKGQIQEKEGERQMGVVMGPNSNREQKLTRLVDQY